MFVCQKATEKFIYVVFIRPDEGVQFLAWLPFLPLCLVLRLWVCRGALRRGSVLTEVDMRFNSVPLLFAFLPFLPGAELVGVPRGAEMGVSPH